MVVRLPVVLVLPSELLTELTLAARESQCSPTVFAAQAIEATLAARRLPGVSPGRCGARLPGDAPTVETEELPDRENFYGPVEPLDPPMLDDVATLGDIV
jgi:hypothetical protein